MRKIILFAIFYPALFFCAFWQRDLLIHWISQSDNNQIPFMIFLAAAISLIPIVPFSVFAGMIGAKYGIFVGTLINWTGSIGAAIILFLIARFVFFHQAQQYIRRFNKMQRLDEMIVQNGLMAILLIRMLPLVPIPVISIYSGLSSILFLHYLIGTAIGKIPGLIMFAYLGNQLFISISSALFGALLYFLFLLVIFSIYRWRYRPNTVKSQ